LWRALMILELEDRPEELEKGSLVLWDRPNARRV
jgi:hypothetical protein